MYVMISSAIGGGCALLGLLFSGLTNLPSGPSRSESNGRRSKLQAKIDLAQTKMIEPQGSRLTPRSLNLPNNNTSNILNINYALPYYLLHIIISYLDNTSQQNFFFN